MSTSYYSTECEGQYGLYYSSTNDTNTTAGATSVGLDGLCIFYFYASDYNMTKVKFEFQVEEGKDDFKTEVFLYYSKTSSFEFLKDISDGKAY